MQFMSSEAERARRARARLGANVFLFLGVLALSALVFPPTAAFLGYALLPSIVAFWIDRDPRKSLGVTVAALNLAGALPFLLDLWMRGHTMARAMDKITDPLTGVAVYGASAIGWGITMLIPPLVVSVVVAKNQVQIAQLEGRMRTLENQWGKDLGVVEALPPAEDASKMRDVEAG